MLEAAQWAAKYAGYSAAAAWVQVVLSAVAGFLLWRSLVQTKKALKEARKSSECTLQSIEINRLSSEAQLRPYVVIDTARFEFDEDGKFYKAILEVKNTGVTPAYEMKPLVASAIIKNGEYKEFIKPKFNEINGQILGSGSLHQLQFKTPNLEYENVSKILSSELLIYVEVAIEYLDSFGVRMGIFYYLESKNSPTGLVFGPSHKGAFEVVL